MSALRELLRKIRHAPRKVGYYWGPRLMSWLRKRWLLFRNPHVDIVFEGPVYLGPGFSLHAPRRATFRIGPGVEFRHNFRAELEQGAEVTIGGGSLFSHNVLIQCTTRIEIRERCMFGQSTLVVDGNHKFRDLSRPMLEQGYDFRPILIEDDATITTKCTIIHNVGKRAFIGANSVVVKPIPPYCVAVGVPAQVVDYFGPPGSEPPELTASRSSR